MNRRSALGLIFGTPLVVALSAGLADIPFHEVADVQGGIEDLRWWLQAQRKEAVWAYFARMEDAMYGVLAPQAAP